MSLIYLENNGEEPKGEGWEFWGYFKSKEKEVSVWKKEKTEEDME